MLICSRICLRALLISRGAAPGRPCAGVAKLVDAPDLGSGAARRGGSSPSTRTTVHGTFDRLPMFLARVARLGPRCDKGKSEFFRTIEQRIMGRVIHSIGRRLCAAWGILPMVWLLYT